MMIDECAKLFYTAVRDTRPGTEFPADASTEIAQFAATYKRSPLLAGCTLSNYSELSKPGENGRASRGYPPRGLHHKTEYAGTHTATLGGPTTPRVRLKTTTAEAYGKLRKSY